MIGLDDQNQGYVKDILCSFVFINVFVAMENVYWYLCINAYQRVNVIIEFRTALTAYFAISVGSLLKLEENVLATCEIGFLGEIIQ